MGTGRSTVTVRVTVTGRVPTKVTVTGRVRMLIIIMFTCNRAYSYIPLIVHTRVYS